MKGDQICLECATVCTMCRKSFKKLDSIEGCKKYLPAGLFLDYSQLATQELWVKNDIKGKAPATQSQIL